MNELIDALRKILMYQDSEKRNICHDAADALERLVSDRNQLKDKLILNICSHCDSRFDYCGECPIIKDINEAFDEQ